MSDTPIRDAQPTPGDASERLRVQVEFLAAVDALKSIERRTRLIGGARRENSAEHSWHLALALLVLREHAPEGVDLARVLSMALVHDLVEIDAGDSFVYDRVAMADKRDRELAAAARIFALLPSEQGAQFRALWDEFEAGETAEARYAAAIDRFCGMLLNWRNDGGTWREHDVTASQVLARNRPIEFGAPLVWQMGWEWVNEAVANGWIRGDHDELQT